MSKVSDLLNNESRCVNTTEEKTNCDVVSHPQPYQVADMTYEPIKVINAWGLNFNIGSAVKYLARYKKKFNAVEDLKKAIFYIQDEINHLENNNTRNEV